MRIYFFIIILSIPLFSFSMDKKLLDLSKMSIQAKLPANPAHTTSNNNATQPEYADLNHLAKQLQTHIVQCKTVTPQDLQKTAEIVRLELDKNRESLYGPVLYDLAQYAQELKDALARTKEANNAAIQSIQTTIDGYLYNFSRQEELLKYSLYIIPAFAHPTTPYINFYAAINSFLGFLALQSEQDRSNHFFNIKDILDKQEQSIHTQGFANTDIVCGSKKAAFALYLKNVLGIGNMSSCTELLQQWSKLIPSFVGAELAYGEEIFKHSKQEDRCALVHTNQYDYVGVFDGHGGKFISSHCRNNLIKYMRQLQKNFDQEFLDGNHPVVETLINNGFQMCNQDASNSLHNELQKLSVAERDAVSKQGSAALICFIPRDRTKKSMLVTLGDSEAYLIQNDTHKSLTPYLHNVSNPAEIERIQKEHPHDSCAIIGGRVGGTLAVTRAFGNVHPKYISIKPDIYWFDLPANALLVLGTDGIFEKTYDLQTKQDRIHDICKIAWAYKSKSGGEIAGALIARSNPFKGDNKAIVVYKANSN